MKVRVVVGRALLGLVALVLIVSGIDHFVSYRELSEYYASLGWPPSVTEVIGVLQLVGAALLVIPRIQRFAAAIIACALIALLGRQLARGQEMELFLEPSFWMIVALGIGAVLLSFPRSNTP